MKLLPSALLLLLGIPAAFALEWKEQYRLIQAQPLQRTAETTFEFTNRLDRPVKITSVDTSCDCTEATPSTREVAPGASGTIRAHFDLLGAAGTLHRTIIVGTDEPGHTSALQVELVIPEVAVLTPRAVEWPRGSGAAEQTVDIQVAAGLALAIASVQPTSDDFTHRLEIVEPGRHFRLHLAPKSTARTANAAVRLYAKTAAGEDVVFSAYANVR